jgi:hypothetical protein
VAIHFSAAPRQPPAYRSWQLAGLGYYGAVRMGAIVLVFLAGLACTRATPGYCGGEGGCDRGMTCNRMTLLCEVSNGGGGGGGAGGSGGSGGSSGRSGCRSDTECMEQTDAAGPACVTDGGMCIACLENKHCAADKTKPICVAQQCAPCTSDSQCPVVTSGEGLCVADGHCATADELIYVQNVQACSATGGGTAATPYCTAAQGIGALGNGKSVVIMVGAIDPWSLTSQPTGTTFVTVLGRQNATITAGMNVGITVSGAKVDIRRLHLTTGTKSGIVASNGATLIVDRCTIDKFDQAGIMITASAYQITNTILTRNGFSSEGETIYSAVMLRDSLGQQPSVFSHNTLVANLRALSCDMAYPIASSIIAMSTLNAVTCDITPCCMNVDPLLTDEYLLTGGSPCLDLVDDATSVAAVSHDIEGQVRPHPGGRSDCGADEYYPP